MAVLDSNFATVNDTATLRNPGGGRAKSAQSYKATYSGAITSCKMQIKRLGSPTGNAWIEIYASSSGLPTGSVLATSSTRVIDAFSTSQTLQEFTFPTPYIQTANSYYCIAICGDWTESNTDTLQANISYDNGAAYANGLFSFYNGSTWAEAYPTHNSDVAFEIYVSYIKKIMGIPRAAHQIADDPLFSDANLQGYWKLESDGTDSSGKSNTMAVGNAPDYVVGRFGNGAQFTSANTDYLTLADASATGLEITGSRTISCWFKPVAKGVFGTLFAHDDATNGWILYQNDWNYQFLVRGLTTSTYVNSAASDGATGTVLPGVWNHVVAVYDSTNTKLKIFMNGFKTEVTASGSSANSAADFSIGARDKGAAVDLYANGIVDDVAVFDRALTDAEATRLYTGNIKKLMGKTITGGNEIATMPLASDANLQGYWKGENVNDSGPNGYNLTNNNTVTFVTGKFNNGINLVAASSQYLSIADASCANLEISGNQTWTCWIKATSHAAVGMIMAKQNAGAGHNLYVNTTGKIHFACDGLTTTQDVISSNTITDGVWSFIAARYDGTNLTVFVNGTKTNNAGSTGSMSDTNANFNIGRRDTGGSNLYFNGIVDDAAIFNRALTDTEISNIYNTQIKKYMGIINV